MNALDYKRWQQLFLAGFCSFSLLLFGTAFYRSLDRQSLLQGVLSDNESDDVGAISSTSSALHVQEFNRVEVKNGRKLWEVKGLEARFYPAESLVHVNDAHVVIYQHKGKPITFHSKAGKLILQHDSIQRAEMEGDVVIELQKGFTLRAATASYDTESQAFSVPGEVEIDGTGFKIRGTGLRMLLDDQLIRLERDVSSTFEAGATIPDGVKLVPLVNSSNKGGST